jgi:hypothetical protein
VQIGRSACNVSFSFQSRAVKKVTALVLLPTSAFIGCEKKTDPIAEFEKLPPVSAFWSVTMYDGKTQFLTENPINRYLINSPMLPGMKKNEEERKCHMRATRKSTFPTKGTRVACFHPSA